MKGEIQKVPSSAFRVSILIQKWGNSMHWKLPKGIIFSLGIVTLLIAVGTPTFAAKATPTPKMIIHSVIVDSQTNTLKIFGENFGGNPVVTLSGKMLTVITSSNNQIVASFPSTTPLGTYKVNIITGASSSQSGFSVTIGTLGRSGPAGP